METLEDFRISQSTGFLLENPLTSLPLHYEPWSKLIENLSNLLLRRQVRQEVHKLPLLDVSYLKSHRELRLAHTYLGMLASCYFWQNGESDVPRMLPRAIAVPFYKISSQLGTAPMIGHCDVVLSNTLMLVDIQTIMNPIEDMQLIARFTDNSCYDSFFLITSLLELRFTPALPLILESARLSKSNINNQQLGENLRKIASIVLSLINVVAMFHKLLNPDEFFDVIRPVMNGWTSGLIYEGVSDTPFFFTGGSAAQSGVMQSCDALLEIKHSPEREKFLKSMRDYMIKEHREFLNYIDKETQVRTRVNEDEDNNLREAYNLAVTSLGKFRSYHMAIVAKFIIGPSQRANDEHRSLKTKGTGGQDLITFLKSINETTRRHQV